MMIIFDVSLVSTSSTRSWSLWVMLPSLRVILGDDLGRGGFHPSRSRGSAANASRDRLIVARRPFPQVTR